MVRSVRRMLREPLGSGSRGLEQVIWPSFLLPGQELGFIIHAMGKCFVIQPFDKGKFDKRYDDTFSPAIIAAGLEPYRVDRDPGVSIPIDEIEKRIRESDICLADISLDNPNVWYELGYALASGKEIILTCCKSDRVQDKYPFDVQHRRIISYVSESPSDFHRLQKQITEQLQSRIETSREINTLVSMGESKKTEGLLPHEIAILVAISGETISDWEGVPVYSLKSTVQKAGFSAAAVGIGLRQLRDKKFVEMEKIKEDDGEYYYYVNLTSLGSGWLVNNLDMVPLRTAPQRLTTVGQENDIPF